MLTCCINDFEMIFEWFKLMLPWRVTHTLTSTDSLQNGQKGKRICRQWSWICSFSNTTAAAAGAAAGLDTMKPVWINFMDAEIDLQVLFFCVLHFWLKFDSAVYCIYSEWIGMACLSRRSMFWTRALFIWSTTFFGIVELHGKQVLFWLLQFLWFLWLFCFIAIIVLIAIIVAVIVPIVILLLIDIIAIIVLFAFFDRFSLISVFLIKFSV